MPTISLTLVDFMDALPYSGAFATVTYRVVPMFHPRPDPDDPEPPHVPLDDSEARADLGEAVTARGVSDASGTVAVSFDLTEAAVRVRQAVTLDGRRAIGVLGWVDVAFNLVDIRLASRDVLVRLPLGADQSITLPVDLGMSIVGHTTPTSSRLWVHVTFEPVPGHSFHCIVQTTSQPPLTPGATTAAPAASAATFREFPIEIKGSSRTGFRDISLSPGSTHAYRFVVRAGLGPNREVVIARGRFSTPTQQQPSVRFAFGSCHRPVLRGTAAEPGARTRNALGRWQHLAEQNRHEFLLLTGDQIYGDGIEDRWPGLTFEERYNLRYAQLWAHRPTREVLRNTPTYMAIDDHEVADDFGPGNLEDQRIPAAIDAFRAWQHARNPGGPDGPFHFSFRWGPAAYFVVDCRTQRGQGGPAFPVLGSQQLSDFEEWTRSEETLAADVIFLVASVPPALLPAQFMRALLEGALEGGLAWAGILAGLGAGLLGGPFGVGAGILGIAVLGAVGYQVGEEVFERWIDPWLLNDNDIAERWDVDDSQRDLDRLLDALFRLANGLRETNPKKRAVFIIAGDVHVGTVHAIVSRSASGADNHAANPVIYQLSSSAISIEPVDRKGYHDLVTSIKDRPIVIETVREILRNDPPRPSAIDLRIAPWTVAGSTAEPSLIQTAVDIAFGGGDAKFTLDPDGHRRYIARYEGLIMERTVGFASVTRLDVARRRYRFNFAIEGEVGSINSAFDLDLDADQIVPVVDDARFGALDVPAAVRRGEVFRVTAVVTNIGAGPWSSAHQCEIATGPWRGTVKVVSGRVPPGRATRFSFTLTAGRPGVFGISFRMRRRRGNFFGKVTGSRSITVSGRTGDECSELRLARDEAQRRLQALRDQAGQMAEPTAKILTQIRAAKSELDGVNRRIRDLRCE